MAIDFEHIQINQAAVEDTAFLLACYEDDVEPQYLNGLRQGWPHGWSAAKVARARFQARASIIAAAVLAAHTQALSAMEGES